MLIKVCGLKDPTDVERLLSLGVDYFGFISVPRSSRYLKDPEHLASKVPLDSRVLISQDAPLEELSAFATRSKIPTVQLHGSESPSYCATLSSYGLKIWKAFSITTRESFKDIAEYSGVITFALFDHGRGGTGEKFSWDLLSSYTEKIPFFLSGGIGPEDTAFPSHPQLAGIDINSKFEVAPGKKDIQKIATFISQVRP